MWQAKGVFTNMRKCISLLLYLFLLVNLSVTANAATGVPEEVITAVDSVVFITLASDAYSDDDLTYIKEQYPEYVFRNGSSEYVIESSGSGFVIKAENGETLIATNNHVVEADHEGIFVWVTDKKTAHAEVVFSIPEKDLSVIRINGSINKKPVTMAEADASRGEAVYVVGFPGAGNVLSDSLARTSDEATITDGIISAVRSFTVVDGGDSAKILQINAAVNSGNSGGPLFNTEGKVIGVNTYGVEGGTQGVFGAVAISELHALLKDYNIEISDETSTQEEAQPVGKEGSPEEKNQNKVLSIVICAVLGMVCLGVLVTVFRKKTLLNEKLVVASTGKVKQSVETATVKSKNVEMSDVDIGITKRRSQPAEHVDIGTVTMTGKGREKKDDNKSFFSQPNKLDK